MAVPSARGLRHLLAGAVCALGLGAGCRAVGAELPLVVLDPGHGPGHPGAVSIRGTEEVGYNDAFVAVLAPKLAAAGFRVEVTRRPDQELGLDERAALASTGRAWLLLSIHHDSAQDQFLAQEQRDGKPAFRATRSLTGYSLYVSGLGSRLQDSRRIADALGRRLLALGRPPALHHAEPIPGEGRPLLDRRLGIYQYDGLRLLRLATCPAVLLEVGVLVDEADEAYLSDPATRERIAGAVVRALQDVRGE